MIFFLIFEKNPAETSVANAEEVSEEIRGGIPVTRKINVGISVGISWRNVKNKSLRKFCKNSAGISHGTPLEKSLKLLQNELVKIKHSFWFGL